MVYDISYRPKKVLETIDALTGPSFSLLQKVRMNGSGSPRLLIHACSPLILERLARTDQMVYCSIELRPKGILVHFQSNLNVFVWPVAYHHLSIYQNGSSWSIHGGGQFMKVKCRSSENSMRNFLHKLFEHRDRHCGNSIDQGTGS
ncbi:MAG: hypothetical protein HKN79_04215 [Flavobacteriales bacterium]|nr:hypothetical protein [Flavobacteriales bacterium]